SRGPATPERRQRSPRDRGTDTRSCAGPATVLLHPSPDPVENLGDHARRGVGFEVVCRWSAGDAVGMDADNEWRGIGRFVYPNRRAALSAVGVDVVEETAIGNAENAVAVVVLLGSSSPVHWVSGDVHQAPLEILRRQGA